MLAGQTSEITLEFADPNLSPMELAVSVEMNEFEPQVLISDLYPSVGTAKATFKYDGSVPSESHSSKQLNEAGINSGKITIRVSSLSSPPTTRLFELNLIVQQDRK